MRLNQQTAGDALGLSQTAVTNIENGNRKISTFEFAKLTEFYGYPTEFFLARNEEPEAQDLSAVLRRALPEIGHSSKFGIALRKLIDLCRDGLILRQLLDQTTERAIPDYSIPVNSARDAVRQAENVAREERRRLGLGNMPVGNIAGLICSQGIWTAATDLPDSLSGLFANHATVGLRF